MKIIVIGAGKVGYVLAEHLIAEEHDVTIIDRNDEVIDRCSGSLDALCIKGNGANAKILLEAGVDKTNIVIASTESDETNMLAAFLPRVSRFVAAIRSSGSSRMITRVWYGMCVKIQYAFSPPSPGSGCIRMQAWDALAPRYPRPRVKSFLCWPQS